MSRGLVKTSRYSPGNMTGQALEQLFVGRDSLMKKVLKRIAASALRKEKHFILLVGPRGMGKTHFVSLAHHKLKTDVAYAEARARLKVAYLNEEEWGVASFLDLLVRILSALQAEQKDPKLLAGIERIYETFKKGPEAALHVAESLLIEHVQGSTLLLVCENLSDLFEGLGDEGQKRWRAFIQEHPFWTILATTPALFSGVQLQNSPFYNFFSIEPLQRLDFDTAMELLRQRAAMEGQQRLVDFLSTPTGRARVRAIHHLAGGNHRVYVILSDFLDEESLEDLISPFMRMADDLTPYYQDRMRQLSSQQRKIIELLCRESRPVIVKDIAMRCLISPQVAAKQLSELTKDRFVLSTKVGREAHYELAEPLMRICVDIKDNRTEHFKLFVDFLRHWFSGRELRAKLELLGQSAPDAHLVDRLHLTVALQGFSFDAQEPFLEHLDVEAKRCFESKDYQGLVDALSRLVADKPRVFYFSILSLALVRLKRFEDALEVAREGVRRYPDSHLLHYRLSMALLMLNRFEDALGATSRALELKPDDVVYLRAHAFNLYLSGFFERAVDLGRKVSRLDPTESVLLVTASALRRLERVSEAEQEYRACLRISPGNPRALRGLFLSLAKQEKNEEAVALVESEPSLIEGDDFSFVEYGQVLAALGRNEEALVQYDKAIRKDADDAFAYALRALVLVEQGRDEEAVASLKEALNICRSDEGVELILDLLNHADEAAATLAYIEEREKDSKGGGLFPVQRVRALIVLLEYREALAVVRGIRQQSISDVELALLEVEALVGCEGFGAALTALEQILGEQTSATPEGKEKITAALSNVLLIEYHIRGALAMARQIAQLRVVLDKHNQSGLLPAVLIEFLDACLGEQQFASDEWTKACLLLQEALADRSDCRIPLAMLSVAARYMLSDDKSILLELPLEQRTLLLEKLGVEQA